MIGAELAARDHRLREADQRIAGIVEADQVSHAGTRRRRRDLARLGDVERKRLLAPDVLARRERGERHLAVQVVRGADVDDVDRGIGDELPPVARGAPESERAGGIHGVRLVTVRQDFADRRGDVREHGADTLKRNGVRAADESAADEADSIVLHQWVSRMTVARARIERSAASAISRARIPSRPATMSATCSVQAPHEGVELEPIGIGVALEEEGQGRIAAVAAGRRVLDARRPVVSGRQHAPRPADFDALVVAEGRAPGVDDLRDAPARGAQRDRGRVDVARLADRGIDEAAAVRRDLRRFFAEQPARHVEIVDRHVAEHPAGALDVGDRRRCRVAAHDEDGFDVADLAVVDSLTDAAERRVIAAVEPDRQQNAGAIRGRDALACAADVEIDRFFAEHRLAGRGASLDQRGVRVGRARDQERVDAGVAERGRGVHVR